MTDLAYSLSGLTDLAHDLDALAKEFDGSSDTVHSHGAALGHPVVIDALEEFASNWRRHRDKLSGKLKNTAKMAQACHDGFKETDDHLAHEIAEAVEVQTK